jgi:uncharacterized Tic20 family protein
MNISGEQKMLAVLAHLAYLLGGLGFIVAPLIIFLLKKDDPFVHEHAKQALVAHLAIVVISAITGVLSMILIGLLLLPVLALLCILLFITSIIAAIKAIDGQPYEYPFIQKLVNKL